MLEETVHVQIGQQRTYHAPLRGALTAALATTASYLSRFIAFFHFGCQPQLNQPQYFPVHHPPRQAAEEFGVWNCIEVAAEVRIDHLAVPLPQSAMNLLHGIFGAALRPVAVGVGLEV